MKKDNQILHHERIKERVKRGRYSEGLHTKVTFYRERKGKNLMRQCRNNDSGDRSSDSRVLNYDLNRIFYREINNNNNRSGLVPDDTLYMVTS